MFSKLGRDGGRGWWGLFHGSPVRLPELPTQCREGSREQLAGRTGWQKPTDVFVKHLPFLRNTSTPDPQGLRDFFGHMTYGSQFPGCTELRVMAVKVLSPNHWIVRELLLLNFF